MGGDRFVDTNILLAATASARPEHLAARRLLDEGFAMRSLFASGQVIREYLAVATRPAGANGLGLTSSAGLRNARELAARLHLLSEDERVHQALLDLLERVPCLGKQVHDANIAATLIAHGIRTLVTFNAGDFRRFAGSFEIAAP
jgi:predicted nucleic acid-binding protein